MKTTATKAKLKGMIMGVAVLALSPIAAMGQGNGVLQLKNRSSFNTIEGRNPFWPIGYVAGSAVVASPDQPAVAKPLIKPEDFTLTSISSFGGTRMATLCGKPVAEGDMVKVPLNGQPAKVQVVRVTDGSVVLRYMGQEVTVVLKRPELNLTTRPVKPEPLLHSQEEE